MNDWSGLVLKEKRLYNIWINMLQRCENPKRGKYVIYGARGISVCKEWHDFTEFVKWAYQNGYEPRLTLDRINNDGNYEPSNCRWTNATVQANNRSTNVTIEICGVIGNASQWARLLGISKYTIFDWCRTYGIPYAAERIIETIKNGGVKKRRRKTINCSLCGSEFEAPVGTAKYCSRCKSIVEKEYYLKYRAKQNKKAVIE